MTTHPGGEQGRQRISVELFRGATNRRITTVEMSFVPRKGDIVWIESRSLAMMVRDVIWNAEADKVQLYLDPDPERL